VVNELLNNDPSAPVEIGLDSGRRHTLALEDAPYPSGEIKLNPGEVVVITGGAKGISASVAYALAKQVKPTLVLIGRSPFPKPEPVWLSSVEGEAAVKKAIFEHEFSSNSASPIQLENAFKAHMSNREITKTLEKISAAGAKAIYYRADVSDADKIKSVFDDVRSAHGPIKAVIHGAGLLIKPLTSLTRCSIPKSWDSRSS
jgi:NAD(P)-dependent dehydrogenase (short-subunit alcohol dehydrogenase family)